MKSTSLTSVTALSAITLFCQTPAQACSIFHLEGTDDAITAKGYDYDTTTGQAFINDRGREKTALVTSPKHWSRALKWVSKYGSVSFTQVGQEFAFSGMNEMGLVIEPLDLDETIYPAFDSKRKYLNEGQIVQYTLDTAATVSEAVTNLQKLGIARLGVDLHYFVCDSTRACATLEFIQGKLVVHTGKDLPIKAFTNSTYENSIKNYQSVDASRLRDYANANMEERSLMRFQLITESSKNASRAADPIQFAFDALERVAVANPSKKPNERLENSQWNLVYNQTKKKLYFRSHVSPTIKEVDFSAIDFNCKPTSLFMDMSLPVSGNVSKEFRPITLNDRKELIKQFSATSFLQNLIIPSKSAASKCVAVTKP